MAKHLQHWRARKAHKNDIVSPSCHASCQRSGDSSVSRTLVIKRAVRFDVRNAGARFRGYLGEPRDLFEYALRESIRREIEFHAAEVGTIGITRMRANGHLPSKRLLHRRSHCSVVTGVPPAS